MTPKTATSCSMTTGLSYSTSSSIPTPKRSETTCAKVLTRLSLIDLKKISSSNPKIPDQKRLNSVLLQKMISCTQYLNKNWQEIDNLPINKKLHASGKIEKSCFDYFYDFNRSFVEYIKYEV